MPETTRWLVLSQQQQQQEEEEKEEEQEEHHSVSSTTTPGDVFESTVFHSLHLLGTMAALLCQA